MTGSTAAQSDPIENSPAAPSQAPADVLGSAEWAVRVALAAPDSELAALALADPADRPRATASRVEVAAAVAVRAESAGDQYWAVTVATDVRSAVTGAAQRWYLEVGVVETGSGPVAITDPALVPAPLLPVNAVQLDGPAPARPDRSDAVVTTVESFLVALVTGDPTVNRWTAPGVEMWPAAAPGALAEVDLTAIAVERNGSSEATARAEVAVVTTDDLVVVFAYTVRLSERDGRWEVLDVGATPPLRRIVDPADLEPLAPPPTDPPASTAATTSPTTNP